MRRITTLLIAMALFMGTLFGSQVAVRAKEAEKEETISPEKQKELWEEKLQKEESSSAYELCYSATSWEEYKESFENFECEQGDINGRTLKELPETLNKLSTFWSMGILRTDEEADKLKLAIEHAISLYNDNEQGNLTFSVTKIKRGFQGPNTEIHISADKVRLTHLGNVVISANVPYYENVNAYLEKREAYYYQKQILSYTCKAAYWNLDGTLEKVESIPIEKLATIKDSEKIQIDTNFEGTILILLCTTDEILGWANIEELYQYEDESGNMEFYNSEFIKYYEE